MKKWMNSTSVRPKVTSLIKSKLDKEASNLIKQTLKPKNVKPLSIDCSSNYLADIYSKWYGNSFYFCAIYNSPGENAISPSFEIKFARMVYVGDEKFNVSYMRYNGKWCELHKEFSMQECLNAVENEPYFVL
ncbi:hypothetical protein [Psychromonas aquimarina]|uniref:DUF3024 domain-containing protein n=1 Tax=Psychromonas aquimarina TaxID=444919 RepID=UPI00048D4E3C|nr:hypothetical protein [Psychromonas aquimarina]